MNLSWGCPPSEDYLKLLVKESGYEPLDEEGYGKIVIDADGVWVHYPDGSKTLLSVDSFLELEDTPSSYSGEGGKVVAVKTDESGLEFTEVEATDEKVKADSEDTTAGYLSDKVDNATIEVDTSNHYLKVKDGVFAAASHTHDWDDVDKAGSKLEDIEDVPAYSGNAGKVLAVKSDESGTEWVEGGSGADPNAVHVNEAGEINGVSLKSSPVGADVVLIEDSEDSWNKKKVELSNLLGGSSGSSEPQIDSYFLNVIRTTAFDLGATNTWYSIPFDTILKNNGFEKVSDTQYKVLHTGTYELKYSVHIKQVSIGHHISAILTRNGSEIAGSWSQDSMATEVSSEVHRVEGSVIVDLTKDDIIELKVATNQDVANEVDVHPSTYLPTPNTWVYASLIIKSIGNITISENTFLQGCVFSADFENSNGYYLIDKDGKGRGIFNKQVTFDSDGGVVLDGTIWATIKNIMMPSWKATYHFRFKTTYTSGRQRLIANGSGDDTSTPWSNNFDIALDSEVANDAVYLFTETGDGVNATASFNTGINLHDGNVHDLIVRLRGNKIDIMVDGVWRVSDADFTNAEGNTYELYRFFTNSNTDNDYFNGTVYAVDIFNRSLDDDECYILASEGYKGIGGTYENFKLTDVTSDITIDKSGYYKVSGDVTVTISGAGRFGIKNVGTGTVTIQASGSTIDGQSSIQLAGQYDAVVIAGDSSSGYYIF